MYRVIDKRGSGKTLRLMLIAKENNAVFVCSNPQAMENKAAAYGITGIDFITYRQFLSHDFEGHNRKFVIDELSNMVMAIGPLGSVFTGYSLTDED